MTKIFFRFVYFCFAVLFLFYLAKPATPFPSPPSDALQSKEPGDTETLFRRAYFTNYTRAEVMNHYASEFSGGMRLNYPPEESATIIRDQTRSTFLEEIVHPLRESLFINGFEPKAAKDAIEIEGRSFRQKIIVRYVGSSLGVRISVGLLTLVLGYLIIGEISKFLMTYLTTHKKNG